MRIVSFLPTGTEILLALGAAADIVGISHENLQIDAVRDRPVVSSLIYDEHALTAEEVDRIVSETYARGESIYKVDAPRLQELAPDLLITQELCDVCAVTPNDFQRALQALQPAPEVLSLNAHRLEEALEDIRRTGAALGRKERGEELAMELGRRRDAVAIRALDATRRPSVFCLEWPKPLFNAGHWVPEMIELAGGQDTLGAPGEYSSRLEWERLRDVDPEIIVAMLCGYPRERAHKEMAAVRDYPGWDDLSAVRHDQVWIVDGPTYFSQAGPRLFEGLEILSRILHPEIFGAPTAEQAVHWPG